VNTRTSGKKAGQRKPLKKTNGSRSKTDLSRKVSHGEFLPSHQRRKFPEPIQTLARRYIWWLSSDESLAYPLRVIAQVMDIGTWDDCGILEDYFGRAEMRRALKQAEPGWFRPRSWVLWHYCLGLTKWGDEPPSIPARSFDA
jgi:hypothetical protein